MAAAELSVNGTTLTENLVENDPEWANQTCYFKAGVYQDHEGPATEGARVGFSELTAVHAPGSGVEKGGER